jgi:hypothetical protein
MNHEPEATSHEPKALNLGTFRRVQQNREKKLFNGREDNLSIIAREDNLPIPSERSEVNDGTAHDTVRGRMILLVSNSDLT